MEIHVGLMFERQLTLMGEGNISKKIFDLSGFLFLGDYQETSVKDSRKSFGKQITQNIKGISIFLLFYSSTVTVYH